MGMYGGGLSSVVGRLKRRTGRVVHPAASRAIILVLVLVLVFDLVWRTAELCAVQVISWYACMYVSMNV
jgi:hypothetical protein